MAIAIEVCIKVKQAVWGSILMYLLSGVRCQVSGVRNAMLNGAPVDGKGTFPVRSIRITMYFFSFV